MKPSAIFQVVFYGLLVIINASCLKKDFDSPPDKSGYDPKLEVNLSIAELHDRLKASLSQKIDSDWTIYGIVTANDKSGNFYKQITVEDETGGVTVNIDATNLHVKFPVGRKIYLKLKGLYYGFDAMLPQIGGVPDNQGIVGRISGAKVDEHLVRANFPNAVPTTHYADLSMLQQTNVNMLNRLVSINGLQVVKEDTAKTFASPPSVSSGTSITLQDCEGRKIFLRTSAYADFQGVVLPVGRGTVKGIYTVFNNIPQLIIREASDIDMPGARCADSTPPTATKPLISVDSLRRLYTGSNLKLGALRIAGVVISDAANRNVSSGSIVLQQGDKGILIYWGGELDYKIGDSLIIDVTGDSLILYQGALEIKKNLGSSRPTPVANNRSVSPKELTIAKLNIDFLAYESTLVKIREAVVLGGGTYGGSKTLSDGTGSITMYTSFGAVFADVQVPTIPKTYIGIVTPFTGSITKEIKLRNPDIDVY